MTLTVSIVFAVAFLVALAVAWTRERRRREKLERATMALLVLCVAGGFVAISQQAREIKETQAQTAREGVERRDQICRAAEREHLAQVVKLQRTYDYLEHLRFDRPLSLLNKAILRQLPEVELQARTDVAPDFCDEPGAKAEKLWRDSHGKQGAPPVGLPEPDPVVPQRPAGIPPTR